MKFLLREWDSKSELLAHAENMAIVLGINSEAPRRFYSFEYEQSKTEYPSIGIISSGFGIKPVLSSFQNGTLVILHDRVISFLNRNPLELVKSCPIEGVGLELLKENSKDLVIVVSELELSAFDVYAERKWSFTAGDLIEDWELGNNHDITISCADNSRQTIDLIDGSLKA